MEKKKLADIQQNIENLISEISDQYIEHPNCNMVIHNLRGAADGIHTIRFDKALSEKYVAKQKDITEPTQVK